MHQLLRILILLLLNTSFFLCSSLSLYTPCHVFFSLKIEPFSHFQRLNTYRLFTVKRKSKIKGLNWPENCQKIFKQPDSSKIGNWSCLKNNKRERKGCFPYSEYPPTAKLKTGNLGQMYVTYCMSRIVLCPYNKEKYFRILL